MSNERVIVQRGASKALIEALTRMGQRIRSGPREDAQISPLITSSSAERVISLVKDAKSRGAEVLLGDLKHEGAYVKPHIVLGFEPGWRLWEEESFGPIFGIKVVDTEDEAIQLANRSDYSLIAALFTKDIEKGLKLSRRIRAGKSAYILITPYRISSIGHVTINGPTYGLEPTLGVHGLG